MKEISHIFAKKNQTKSSQFFFLGGKNMSMKCPPIYSFVCVCVWIFLNQKSNYCIARRVATSLNFTLRSIESDDSIPDDELQSMNGSDGQQAGRHAIPTGNSPVPKKVGWFPSTINSFSVVFENFSHVLFLVKKRCDT